MKYAFYALAVSCTALTACGPGGVASTTTRSYAEALSTTPHNISLDSEWNDTVSNGSVGTVAYTSGLDLVAGQAVTATGIVGTPTVGSARTSGSGTYDVDYEYDAIDSVVRTDTTLFGTRTYHSGNITLNADFDAGTLTGSDFNLDVNGTISGTDVGGSVTAQAFTSTVDGDLDGLIGTTGVIATFHGTDSNTTMAGGFVGTAN